jgi:hypothetical protein
MGDYRRELAWTRGRDMANIRLADDVRFEPLPIVKVDKDFA